MYCAMRRRRQSCPIWLRKAAMELPESDQRQAEELRLRAGRPMTVLLPSGERELEAAAEPEELETLCDLRLNFPATRRRDAAGGISSGAGGLSGGALRHCGHKGRRQYKSQKSLFGSGPHRPGAAGDR